MVDVVILFLAHEGVTQPGWWELALNNASNKAKIAFKVHSPLVPKYGKTFCNKYHIGFYDETTSWCNANLVLVQLEAMKAITLEYPDREIIVYLVSGYDIPLYNLDVLFKNVNYKNTKICIIQNNICHQWMALNSTDINALYKILIDDKYYYTLLREKYFQKNGSKETVLPKGGGCPDETFIYTTILKNNEKFKDYGGLYILNNSNCITLDPRSNTILYKDGKYISRDNASPVLWTSLTEKQIVQNIQLMIGVFNDINKTDKCVNISLELYLKLFRLYFSEEDNFFFRKISDKVRLNSIKYFLDDLETVKSYNEEFKRSEFKIDLISCKEENVTELKNNNYIYKYENVDDYLNSIIPPKIIIKENIVRKLNPTLQSYLQNLNIIYDRIYASKQEVKLSFKSKQQSKKRRSRKKSKKRSRKKSKKRSRKKSKKRINKSKQSLI